jgi:hypothetical protein
MAHLIRLLLVLSLVVGCASGGGPSPAAGPASPGAPAAAAPAAAGGCRTDAKLQRVCLGDDFRLGGYDVLYIAETQAQVPRLNADGKESLEWARGVLQEELAAAIRSKNLFAAVVTREADVKPGGRTLRLESTIIEYEKGGGGARYWAGLYGAGQPVIKVRGRMMDGDRQAFLFETRRSGVGGKARWLGGVMSDREIQTRDIQDLADALVEFMAARR